MANNLHADVLWTLQQGGHVIVCRMLLLKEGYQATVECDGSEIYAFSFSTAAQVIEWTTGKRRELLAEGWLESNGQPAD